MATYLGQAGRDAGTISITGMDLSGDVLTVSGYGLADTEADVKALRQQLLGLGTDEPIIPVTFSGDTSHEGFYEVGAVQISDAAERGLGQLAGAIQFQITLRRIAGYAYPLIQSAVEMFVRTNSVSVSGTTSCFWACPAACTEVYFSPNTAEVATTRTSADGNMSIFDNPSAAGAYQISWGCTPANYYVGAATIEVGSSLRRVVGRQLDGSVATPAAWRIQNGMVRVTPTLSGGSSTGGLTFQWYDGSQWEPSGGKLFTINDRNTGSAIGAFQTLRVLRASPELCVLRLSALDPGLSSGFWATIDLALRRGSRFVEILISGGALSYQWQVRRASVEATTSITGGIRATSNDGDTNRFLIVSPQTCTADNTNGRLGLTSAATTGQFGVGVEIGGSGATGTDTATTISGEYFDVTSERQTVVGR